MWWCSKHNKEVYLKSPDKRWEKFQSGGSKKETLCIHYSGSRCTIKNGFCAKGKEFLKEIADAE